MTFTEDWYAEIQLDDLSELLYRVLADRVAGLLIEIGCWEGRSTVALAKASESSGRVLHAVDWWLGNLDEGEDHPSVVGARQRDVYQTFMDNISPFDHVQVHRQDGAEFLRSLAGRIAFLHLDAGHTYGATKQLIDLAVPLLAPWAIICGDDFASAHAGRTDLDGGVERATREAFGTDLVVLGNLWYYQNGA